MVGPSAIEILVVTDEPSHAAYLSAVLRLEAPGRFRVRQSPKDGSHDLGRPDLVLLLAEPGDAIRLPGRACFGVAPPVIVVADGPIALDALDRLILEGADDVIDVGRLTPHGLASAVLKAVSRRLREPAAGLDEGVLALG